MSLLESAPQFNPNRPNQTNELGIDVWRVHVFDESQQSPTAHQTKALLDSWDEEIAASGQLEPPIFDKENARVIPRNPASARFYEHNDIQEWGQMMPTARALYYLTHLDVQHLPSGQQIGPAMHRFMLEMDDGIGIRTRKRLAASLVEQSVSQAPGEAVECLSLACGAADLMLETTSGFAGKVKLNLVDRDDEALNLGRQIAADENLQEDQDFRILNRDLIRTMIASDDLVQEIGPGSQQVVDAIGINEYFGDSAAAKFLANAYKCVAPGGMLITANMLSDRPQMHINRAAIGWPDSVKPRSLEELRDMLDKAGLPLGNSRILIPDDGVYAVMVVEKPVGLSNIDV